MNNKCILFTMLIFIIVNFIFAEIQKGDPFWLAMRVTGIAMKYNHNQIPEEITKFGKEENLTVNQIACSLMVLIEDEKKNPAKYEKTFQFYPVNKLVYVLSDIKYPPVYPLLLKCFHEEKKEDYKVMNLKYAFNISRNDWFKYCDSIISDSIRFKNGVYNMLHWRVFEDALNDSLFVQSNKDKIVFLLIKSLLLEKNGINTFKLDTILVQISPEEYKYSSERVKYLPNSLKKTSDWIKKNRDYSIDVYANKISELNSIPSYKLHSWPYFKEMIEKREKGTLK